MSTAGPVPTDLHHALELLAAERVRSAALEQVSAALEQHSAALEQHSAALEQHSATLEQRVAEQERVLDATAATHQELLGKYEAALEDLRVIRRWAFGSRRERATEAGGQRHLFDLDFVSGPTEEAGNAGTDADEDPADPQHIARRNRRRERELNLEALPRVEHQHDLPESEKTCEVCGRAKDVIGEDVSRELEYRPASLELHIHRLPKYACRCGQCGVSAPPVPDRPLDRSIAGPGLLAELIVGKFGDHLPLYRLEDILVRRGVHIARSTLCDWVAGCAELLRPLYDLQKQRVLCSPVLWTDDTPVTFLGDSETPGSHTGRYWTYIGDDDHPYSVYAFTTSRRRDGPASFLAGYTGFVHADAYSGYDAIYLRSDGRIVECACMAHARRKFYDARTSQPRECHGILEWIRQLYDIEDRAATCSAGERLALRQSESVPFLHRMETQLRLHQSTALPKSAFGKAVTYALNQWDALCRFTTDGRLTIDNNTAERTLRHQAVGRKNWLFLGSEQAGPRSAILSTVLAGARRHRLEPWAYVRDALLHLHAEPSDLTPLLPDRWATAHPEHVLKHRLDESRRKATRRRDRRAQRRSAQPTDR